MDSQKWRPWAKIVGTVDAILVAFDVLIVSALICGAVVWGPIGLINFFLSEFGESSEGEKFIDPSTDDATLLPVKVFTWVGLVVAVIYCLVEIIAVWKLLVACEQSCEAAVAIRNAKTYRNIKIFFLILYLRSLFRMWSQGVNMFDMGAFAKLIGSVIGIAIVQMFINETKKIIKARTNRVQNNDLVRVDVDDY